MIIDISRTGYKLRMAQENFGVDAIINISTKKLRVGIKRITSGKGVDSIFDRVVNNGIIDSILKILANSGKLVIIKSPILYSRKKFDIL